MRKIIKMKKLCVMCVVGSMTLSLLSGCGTHNDTQDNATKGNPTATPTTAEEDEDKVSNTPDVRTETLENLIFSENFETGETEFVPRGDEKLEIASSAREGDNHYLLVSNRARQWNGPSINMTEQVYVSKVYTIKAKVFYKSGPKTVSFACKVEKNGEEYLDVAKADVKKGEWTELEGSILLPAGTESAYVYFETTDETSDFVDFYLDDVKIMESEIKLESTEDLEPICDKYEEYFDIGTVVTSDDLAGKRSKLLTTHYNSITVKEELYPENILDYDKCVSSSKYDTNPALDFSGLDVILDYAYDNTIPVRASKLIWYNTPRWFFAVDYSKDKNAELVSADVMEKRMQSYIKQIIEHCQDDYPDVIEVWDVVSEAINVGEADNGYRSVDNNWYQIMGENYVQKSFEYASKYVDGGVKLFYSETDEMNPSKIPYVCKLLKSLKKQGLVDGIALQQHYRYNSQTVVPNIVDITTSFMKYNEIGIELHVTDLDVPLKESTEEGYYEQATLFRKIFFYYCKCVDSDWGNITNVTFCGMADGGYPVDGVFKTRNDLLFDTSLAAKYSYYGVMQSEDIPLF